MPFPVQIYQRIDKNKIRKLRVDRKMTITKLAEELCVSVRTVYKFESVKNHIPSIELVIRYCEFFKIPVMEIMVQPYRKEMAERLVHFMLMYEVIDHGTANSMIKFNS